MKLQAIINANHHIAFGDEYDTDLLDTIKVKSFQVAFFTKQLI